MTQVVGGAPPASPPEPRPMTRMERRAHRRERARIAARTVGEVFITSGVLILSFVAYQLWWTNVTAGQASNQIKKQIEQEFQASPPIASSKPVIKQVGDGGGIGLMYIPRLGKTWVQPVVEGATLANLAKGVTHYTGTAMPGQIGNFAVAGHRATHGEPFAYLDQLRDGDLVYVQTVSEWITYRMRSTQIVPPTRVCVLDSVPCQPGKVATSATITLTTCNPRWGHSGRLIWYGDMVNHAIKNGNNTPDQLKNIA